MVYTLHELLIINYGKEKIADVSNQDLENQIFKNARYSPINLLDFFFKNKIEISSESDEKYAVFQTEINQNKIKLFILKSNCLVEKTTILSDDELFGDVLTTITYSEYAKIGDIYHPRIVIIEKINGKVMDTVSLSTLTTVNEKPTIISKPQNYKLTDPKTVQPEIKTEKYTDNIYLTELKHTDDRVMMVEFENFFLVAEAPLNSENGELIIKEAHKISPDKPIKYFVFGHYHPHYLGGVRPFIHKGAKIICSDINKDYVKYIAEARHTIKPDSLELQPRSFQVEMIKDSLTISESKLEMKIYLIGDKSKHTNDYLIYYFPKEKILFQDDLVWIKRDGTISKASPRQAGLYNAIMELNLEVKTIIQSWPVQDYGVKTIIPFEDLELSIRQ